MLIYLIDVVDKEVFFMLYWFFVFGEMYNIVGVMNLFMGLCREYIIIIIKFKEF